MSEITKTYTNDEITIVWKPAVCIHSTVCWKGKGGLPSVFDPAQKPWIRPRGAETQRIVEQVNKCPSGALRFYYNNQTEPVTGNHNAMVKIEMEENGPLLVRGDIEISYGSETKVHHGTTALCRCGKSGNKPFCDGSHKTG